MVDPVFDYPVYGMVDVYGDERFAPLIERELDAGTDAGAIFDRLREAEVRHLREDPAFRERLREIYREAGVNLVSVTMDSYGCDPRMGPEGQRRDLARWLGRIDATGWLHKVTSPGHAREVVDAGDVGVILNTQNLGFWIDGDPEEVGRLYDMGIRIAQLTYNRQNLIGTGCTERVDSGLSEHGVAAVERMNDCGMVVDLSHCGRETTLDAIDVSEAPVAVTHAFARAVADHDRGKTDEELRALAAADGYLGVQVTPPFISPDDPGRAFERFFEHVDHAVSILGADRVGIGSDWGLIPSTGFPEALHPGLLELFSGVGFRPEHGVDLGMGVGPLERYEDWGAIPRGLRERGYSEDEVADIVGRNFLAFWERAVA